MFFYNPYHLGDHLFSISFFNYVLKYKNDIQIYYSCPNIYHNELLPYLKLGNLESKVILEDLKKDTNQYLLFWIDSPEVSIIHVNCNEPKFNIFLKKHFECWIKRLSWNDKIPLNFPDTLFPIDPFYIKEDLIPKKYKDIDIFIINSFGYSGQYSLNPFDWDFLAKVLSKKYKVCTTRKVPGVLCIRDDALKLFQIGILTRKIKYLIGINTSLLVASLHEDIKNVKNIYLFGKDTQFSYQNVRPISNFSEIKINNLDIIEECINEMYKMVLNREGDRDGIENYKKMIYSGYKNFETIYNEMENSSEKKEKNIKYNYQMYHWRDADENGFNHYFQEIQKDNNFQIKMRQIFQFCEEKFLRFLNCYLKDERISNYDKKKIEENKSKIYNVWNKSSKLMSLKNILNTL